MPGGEAQVARVVDSPNGNGAQDKGFIFCDDDILNYPFVFYKNLVDPDIYCNLLHVSLPDEAVAII